MPARRRRRGFWQFFKDDMARTRKNWNRHDREAKARQRGRPGPAPAPFTDPTVFLIPFYFFKGVIIDTIYYGDKAGRVIGRATKTRSKGAGDRRARSSPRTMPDGTITVKTTPTKAGGPKTKTTMRFKGGRARTEDGRFTSLPNEEPQPYAGDAPKKETRQGLYDYLAQRHTTKFTVS